MIRNVQRYQTILDPLAPVNEPRYIQQAVYVEEDDGTPEAEPVRRPLRRAGEMVAEKAKPVYAALAASMAEFEPSTGVASPTSRLIGQV
jgi:hypothetical protein